MMFVFLSWFTAFVTVVLCMVAPQNTMQGPSVDLCQTKTLRLSTVGEKGYINFDNMSLTDSGLGCVLKIEACSSCQIKLDPEVDSHLQFFCNTGIIHSKYCSLGCDYLNVFDMYYMNETNRYYSGLGQPNDIFHSESSNVFIMLCHGGGAKQYRFKIHYVTTKKLKTIVGSSDTSSATGLISSPFFPMGYAQNHEVYEYVLTSTAPNDYIRVTFDDWHLSETSSLYFINSNRHGQFNGESSRPVIISDSNSLKFTFNTGMSLTVGDNRDYIGFRAAYKFYGDRSQISKPNTNCKGSSYYMFSSGGKINFSPSSPTRKLHDCLWVFKTQAGFDGTFLKIIKLRSSGYLFKGDNQLTIRAGLSSVAPVRAVYDMLDNIDNGIPNFSSTGFYVRLNASLSSSDSVILTFASYKNSPGCGSGLFLCNNDRCIDRNLVCDGYDHCGDNSDELSGCADNSDHWDKSYQYTITIGVIVPMVISVFLIMVICLLFVMIRRCRRERLRESRESSERLPTVSEDVSGRRRRRRHRRRLGFFGNTERDLPPTYDEAIQNPPGWYLNVAFGNPVDPSLPQPPSYHEATGVDPSGANTSQRHTAGSPTSSESSQSEVTVCSGNLSDTSSSSDEESTWGMCSGDGEGRRGRRGRHVSSSESESTPGERQRRSVTTSAEQSGTISTSVTTLTDTSEQRERGVDQTEHLNVIPKVRDNDTVANTDLEKKINDDFDDIVVPTGPKPGGSNLNLNECGQEIYSTAGRQDPGTQNQMRLNTAPISASCFTHCRNASSGSEATVENNRKPKKRTRKSKSKKTNNQSVTASNESECDNTTQHVSNLGASCIPDIVSGGPDFTSGVNDNYNVIPETFTKSKAYSNIPPADQTVIENTPYTSPKEQAPLDIDEGYQVVVNVDNDDVLVVYDSAYGNTVAGTQNDVGTDSATGPDLQVSDKCHTWGPAIGEKYRREPAVCERYNELEPAGIDQTAGRSAVSNDYFDQSVRSVRVDSQFSARSGENLQNVGGGSGCSEELSCEDDHRPNSGSHDLTDSSYISLGRDLADAEDIFV